MSTQSMEVPPGLYAASWAAQKTRKLWRGLARIETAALSEQLRLIDVKSPVYIAGVARSGSTIALEMLSQHPQLTCHRYSDFPYIHTPYWRNWLKQRTDRGTQQPQERAHNDRIKITEDSPEAIEEVLWMEYFSQRHSPDATQLLDRATCNDIFELFYRDHIRKLLLVRGRPRYLTKGNYNLTRMAYIQKIFPDACFIIPVRHPINHIASLMKQDALFKEGLRDNLRARRYLQWAGHFEFGPDKQVIHLGDARLSREIIQCWDAGDSVRAWALHWNSLYRFSQQQLASNSSLESASIWLPYEELCADSESSIDRLLEHCGLHIEPFGAVKADYCQRLSEPEYYRNEFSDTELDIIWSICGETATNLGYSRGL